MEAIIRDIGEGKLYRLWILFSYKGFVRTAYNGYKTQFSKGNWINLFGVMAIPVFMDFQILQL